MMNDSQDAVFNRTGRIEIPSSHIRQEANSNKVHFYGLRSGNWSKALDPSTLKSAVLHIDLDSLLLVERRTINDVPSVFDSNWTGTEVELPQEFAAGGRTLKMKLTIALPRSHADAGRILARSSDIVVIDGIDLTGGKGQTLLPVLPDSSGICDLWRLEIEDTGPVVYVNANIPNLSWKDLASIPTFKFAILASCVKEVLQHLVFHEGCRDTWGKPWLELDGVKARELPEVENCPPETAWKNANDFAKVACEAFVTSINLKEKFHKAAAIHQAQGE